MRSGFSNLSIRKTFRYQSIHFPLILMLDLGLSKFKQRYSSAVFFTLKFLHALMFKKKNKKPIMFNIID